jgi:glycerol-3-phosphate acyltransferase PlsY
MPSSLSLIVALALGYLLGSIPFGLLLTRFAGAGDLRSIGSGNIGATNVLRTGRRDLAAATLVADCLRVRRARRRRPARRTAMLAGSALPRPCLPGVAGLAARACRLSRRPHRPSPAWPAVLAFVVVWLGTAYLTRYSSLGALLASLVTPIILVFVFHDRIGGLFVVLTAILWWRHADNIRRLWAGTESRIGAKR